MESPTIGIFLLIAAVLIGLVVTAAVVIVVWAISSGSQRQAHRRAPGRRKVQEPEPDRSSAGPILVGCVVLGGLLGVALAGAIAVYLFSFGKGDSPILLIAPVVGLATVIGLALLVAAAVRRGASSSSRGTREPVARSIDPAGAPSPRAAVHPPAPPSAAGRAAPSFQATAYSGAKQLFAGCGLLLLIPVGVTFAFIIVPAWQNAGAAGSGSSWGEFLAFGCVAAIYWWAVIRLFGLHSVHESSKAREVAGAGEPAPPVVVPPAPPRPCPKCGALIDSAAPQGLCPRCLLQGVMPGQERLSPTLAFIEAYVAPSVEEVQGQFPHLQIIRLIGQGGMGAVYLARQPALDRLVALKLVRPHDDPTFTERFVREAKALARLSHPNIVAVYESGEAGGLPYLVMEYVDGFTLRDAMRERKLTPAEALAIVPQICDALDYAHSQGVVHRDIKPENILVQRDEGGRMKDKTEADSGSSFILPPSSLRVKIADFGLAKIADPAAISLTGTQQAMGTPHYMAPEQWERPGEVDHRADIYALGVVLYELLTGELPLGRFEPPSRKVRLDLRIDDVVLRALAKEPGSRYQHASDVRIALSAIQAGTEIPGWVRTPTFAEYRSRTTLFGWPLVHIVRGRDPGTGRGRVAKGWIAIGDSAAVGGIAIAGGWAAGVLAIAGGGAFGVLALAGGLTIAGIALAGGWAAGLVAAGAGGVAASLGMAVAGGYAVAWKFAIAGGSAVARHVLSSQKQDPDFEQQLMDWLNAW